MFGGWRLNVGGMEERVEFPSWMGLVTLLPISYYDGVGIWSGLIVLFLLFFGRMKPGG